MSLKNCIQFAEEEEEATRTPHKDAESGSIAPPQLATELRELRGHRGDEAPSWRRGIVPVKGDCTQAARARKRRALSLDESDTRQGHDSIPATMQIEAITSLLPPLLAEKLPRRKKKER